METKTTVKKTRTPKPKATEAGALSTPIYNKGGKKAGTINLPENIFGVTWNDALMHQVVTSMQSNARTNVAHAKGRGDVRGGGKKPWQQKGTGRARHGSIRSPIWKGGGVTHGPLSEKNYEKRIPKKMRAKALFMALSKKLQDGEVILVDSFAFEAAKTAAAKSALIAISESAKIKMLIEKPKNAALIALTEPRPETARAFQNIKSVDCGAVRNLNPVSVLSHSYILIEDPEAAVAILAHRAAKKNRKAKLKTQN